MKQFLILSFLLSSVLSFGQGWIPAGGRSMSLGNASATMNDVWAFHNNPGALADMDKFSVGVSYENRFLLKELQSQAFAVAIPLKVGVISVGGNMYGYTQFRSYKAGLGYSMKLSEMFYAGVQLNYQGLRLADFYGSKNSVTAEAGLYAKFTEKWKLGISVYNLGRAKLSDYEDDRYSTIMRLGSSYDFSEKLMLAIEVEKDLDNPVRFKTGLEYEVINDFYLRGGIKTTPLELTFGLGYHLKQVHINVGSAYHQVLGWAPHFSIAFVGK
ncbi:MAG: hypothetical protein ACPGVI_03780 [Crocinitomicaceae bacterium]